MATVTLKIGPRSYEVGCADGEEKRVNELAGLIAERYEQLGASRGPRESQNLLFTALFMADELADLRKNASKADHEKARSGGKKAELRAEIETLRKSEARAREEIAQLKENLAEMREASRHQHDLFGDELNEGKLAEMLEALAERAEATASALESTSGIS